jgi:hypothetical protein
MQLRFGGVVAHGPRPQKKPLVHLCPVVLALSALMELHDPTKTAVTAAPALEPTSVQPTLRSPMRTGLALVELPAWATPGNAP